MRYIIPAGVLLAVALLASCKAPDASMGGSTTTRLDASSSGDTLAQNTVSGAGGNYTDASSGSGTTGTANHWTDNTATDGSTPSGLCAEP